jgi:hypothetical protein
METHLQTLFSGSVPKSANLKFYLRRLPGSCVHMHPTAEGQQLYNVSDRLD